MPALVLIHGFAGCAGSWDEVVGHLDRQRYRPLALELPGPRRPPPASSRSATSRRRASRWPRRRGRWCFAAIRSAPASRSPRRCSRPSASRGLLLVSGHAGIEDGAGARGAPAGRRGARRAHRAARRRAVRRAVERTSRSSPATRRRSTSAPAGSCSQSGPPRSRRRCACSGPASFAPVWDQLGEPRGPARRARGRQRRSLPGPRATARAAHGRHARVAARRAPPAPREPRGVSARAGSPRRRGRLTRGRRSRRRSASSAGGGALNSSSVARPQCASGPSAASAAQACSAAAIPTGPS